MRKTYYSGSYKKGFDIGRGRVATFTQWGDVEKKSQLPKIRRELRQQGYLVRTEPIKRYGRIQYYIIWIKPKR